MKAVKYLAMAVVALVLPLTFSSCDDDDEETPMGTGDPLNLMGTTWQVTNSDDTIMEFDGATITFQAGVGSISIPSEEDAGGTFTYEEGDGGVLQLDFGDSSITGVWQGDDSGATFSYAWDDYGVIEEMALVRVG